MSRRGIAIVRQHLGKLPPVETMSIAEQRAQYDRAPRVFPTPPDVKVEPAEVGGVRGEWLRPPGAREDCAVLYLHGGGYVIGSLHSHRHLAAAIAAGAGVVGFVADYRLAPEHPFPAAVEDGVAAYRGLLARGFDAGRIVIAGDSAGGGLTVATMLALRDRGVALPAGGVCISPWVDMTCSGASYETKAASDPIVKRASVGEMAQHYLGGADPRNPLASPVCADLHGLPPLLVQVGTEEVLLDDAVALVDRAKAAGVDATLEVWPEMIHVWHWFLTLLDEAEGAVAKIGEFVRSRVQ